jgi:hypothetical protein
MTTEPTNAAESAGDMLERLGCDAVLWAAEFRRIALKLGYSDMDEGWLIGWFANAIEQSAHSHPDVVRRRLAATRRRAGAGGLTEATGSLDGLRKLVERARTLSSIPMGHRDEIDLCIFTIVAELDDAERELSTLSPASQADEVTEAEAALDLIREEATKDNSPLGRSDSLALANIRKVLAAMQAKSPAGGE